MDRSEALSISACDHLLQSMDGLQQQQRGDGLPFPMEKSIAYFALAYSLLEKQLPNLVNKDFVLLAITQKLGVAAAEAQADLSKRFLTELNRVEGTSADLAVVELEQRFLTKQSEWERAIKLGKKELATFSAQLSQLAAEDKPALELAASDEAARQLEDADTVINTCIQFVKKAQEAQKRPFAEAKYVLYYAYFLNLLLVNGLPLKDKGSLFFAELGKKIKLDSPGKKSAMEFKFYNSLSRFGEFFAAQATPQAVNSSLRLIEGGKPDAAKVSDSILKIGTRASDILLSTISELY